MSGVVWSVFGIVWSSLLVDRIGAQSQNSGCHRIQLYKYFKIIIYIGKQNTQGSITHLHNCKSLTTVQYIFCYYVYSNDKILINNKLKLNNAYLSCVWYLVLSGLLSVVSIVERSHEMYWCQFSWLFLGHKEAEFWYVCKQKLSRIKKSITLLFRV